ncbi:MAG: zinc ribbon domain-containing protein [candidate division Zixibacteria bacterium]|nr:zinc ribbon domain-containing protein [candidate division Zixibacteria bacterium]
MAFCPFCGEEIEEGKTFCQRCGYSNSLALPYPSTKVGFSNLLLASLGLISGIGSCIFSLLPYFNYLGFLLVISTIVFSGISLEKLTKKYDTVPVKVLSVIALIFAAVGYLLFIFYNSKMPGSGSHA